MGTLTFAFMVGGVISVLIFILLYYLYQKISKKLKQKYIPEKAAKFTCLDGHITRSKGEMIIDNYLTLQNIEHEYENTIRVRGKKIKYDWYLPAYDIYIEYWGYYGKDYMDRKEEKIKLYSKGKLILISIEDKMLEDIYTELKNKLTEYIDLEIDSNKTKHCPKCGRELDERFYL